MNISQKLLNQIKDLCYQPLTDREIANTLNISMTFVKTHRKLMGIPLWKNLNVPIMTSNILALSKNNLTDKEIGKILNKDYRTIAYYRKLASIPPSKIELTYQNEYDRIRGYMIRNTKSKAKERNIKFDLKYTDFELPEFCPLLGIKLTYGAETNGNDDSHSSIDRVDNNKGYIKGNVIVISKLANAMKNSSTFSQLKVFCKNIILLINNYENQGALGNITDIFPNLKLKET